MRGRVRWVAALPAVSGVALAAVLLTAGPAAAGVSVRADNPVPGRFTKLTFRTPSESSSNATTRLKITVPQHPPVLFVRLRPHPGWKVDTRRRKLARPQTFDGERVDSLVTEITLTAEKGKGIPPRQFDEFELTAGPLPQVRALEFPVLQEYDDGRKVDWNQPWTGPQRTTARPVPRIVLSRTAPGGLEGAGAADPLARLLGGTGVCLAALALAAFRWCRPRGTGHGRAGGD